MGLKDDFRALNSLKNMVAYAPKNLIYSSLFTPAKENALLAAINTEYVDSKTLVDESIQPLLVASPAHVSLFRRPRYHSPFISFQEAIQHITTPAMMAIVASIEAAKSLLNALLLFPYHLVLAASSTFTGNFNTGFQHFNAAGGSILITAYWMFSALIDPCLELVSCITRTAATCIYGWGQLKTVQTEDRNAFRGIVREHAVGALQRFLETQPAHQLQLHAYLPIIQAFTTQMKDTLAIANDRSPKAMHAMNLELSYLIVLIQVLRQSVSDNIENPDIITAVQTAFKTALKEPATKEGEAAKDTPAMTQLRKSLNPKIIEALDLFLNAEPQALPTLLSKVLLVPQGYLQTIFQTPDDEEADGRLRDRQFVATLRPYLHPDLMDTLDEKLSLSADDIEADLRRDDTTILSESNIALAISGLEKLEALLSVLKNNLPHVIQVAEEQFSDADAVLGEVRANCLI